MRNLLSRNSNANRHPLNFPVKSLPPILPPTRSSIGGESNTSAIARDTLAEYLDAQEMRSATLEAFFSQTVMQRFQPADNNIERARK